MPHDPHGKAPRADGAHPRKDALFTQGFPHALFEDLRKIRPAVHQIERGRYRVRFKAAENRVFLFLWMQDKPFVHHGLIPGEQDH